ncbi:MAG: hypothetical protein IT385_04650 [Deltaproteobacteria bacterium]|nr:hypothetical protein [Deltaproteobacteria bacterium]
MCGNVHFPPNGESHYDYANPGAVLSSCATFGRGDVRASVTTADWAANTTWPDCGGEFLVWWLQRMPGPSGAMRHPDGRVMPSLWPFLFY